MSTCFECDAPADHHHHVIPRSLGGRRTVPLCGACHSRAHGLDGQTWTGHRELTRAALARKKARGERVGAVPYGYRLAADGATLEADPDEARAVALIIDLRRQGLSLRKISDRLREIGLMSRRGDWHPTQVTRILQAAEAAEAR